ncbi:MAG: symmetrical bis(5'-nucleosyl)-tetraphosphatase [Gammaproteobacteria bacterium]|nr:symmetrical bis(5'-nucleosyl)-tetraphosphatase [Gammaproteobacteria bacterium]
MTTYAIGDVQGCYDELQALLDLLKFDFRNDTLWLTGDLVNRGPRSLEVLRFIKSLGECAVTVLGNHDLHLLAVAYGHEPPKKNDTLTPILAAPDRDELLLWLRTRPLLHRDEIRNLTLVHAGVAPEWTLQDAVNCAREAETALRDDSFNDFLKNMYGNEPDQWAPELKSWNRLRFIINCFTRLRYVNGNGRLKLNAKGAPGSQANGCVPWFQSAQRRTRNDKLLFGHWSTLGFHNADNVIGLDGGCIWGGKLIAINVDTVISAAQTIPICVPCRQWRTPGEP